MDITYLGHSCFKLRGKNATAVTDPYQATVGFELPTVSADVITVSHDHSDHNNVKAVSGTARRKNPFIVTNPGAYEVEDISVFGVATFHDNTKGTQRGGNVLYKIYLDDIIVAHLGDLGHTLTAEHKAALGDIDVLLIPVGGHFTIGPEEAVKIAHELDPAWVIPMHYNTSEHNQDIFADVAKLEVFLQAFGAESQPAKSLTLEPGRLPEEPTLQILTKS